MFLLACKKPFLWCQLSAQQVEIVDGNEMSSIEIELLLWTKLKGESFEITLCIIRAAHLQTEKYAFTKILFHYFNGVLNLFCLCLYFLYWLLSSLAKNQRKIGKLQLMWSQLDANFSLLKECTTSLHHVWSITYQRHYGRINSSWPIQQSRKQVLKHNKEIGVMCLSNVIMKFFAYYSWTLTIVFWIFHEWDSIVPSMMCYYGLQEIDVICVDDRCWVR